MRMLICSSRWSVSRTFHILPQQQCTVFRRFPTSGPSRLRQVRSLQVRRQQQEQQRLFGTEQPKQLLVKGNAEQLFLSTCLRRITRLMHPEEDVPQMYPHWNQLLRQCNAQSHIDTSSISGAGRGLFATCDIQKGSIISFYPAHLLGMEVDNADISEMVFSSTDDEAYFEKNNFESECGNSLLIVLQREDAKGSSTTAFLDAILRCHQEDDVVLHLDVNPHNHHLMHPAWYSHIINDGAKADVSQSEQGAQRYFDKTNQRRNCFHIPFGPAPVMATVATRDVSKGEEFFTSYDYLYWAVDASYNLGHGVADDDDDGSNQGQMYVSHAMEQEANAMDDALLESSKGVSNRYKDVIQDITGIFDQIDNSCTKVNHKLAP